MPNRVNHVLDYSKISNHPRRSRSTRGRRGALDDGQTGADEGVDLAKLTEECVAFHNRCLGELLLTVAQGG